MKKQPRIERNDTIDMSTSNEIKQKIKDYALNSVKVDKIGFADISRFNEAPEGFHPEDFLPGCKTVIVCAIGIPDGAAQSIFRMLEDKRDHVHGIYGAYGYVGALNYSLLFAAQRVARFVENLTHELAAACPAGPTHGTKSLSIRHAAVAAGIADFGWHSICITPEFGTRNRFCVIMTTAELGSDPLYDGPELCNPQKCGICAKVCPLGAIPEYNKKHSRCVNMGGKTYEYAMFNANLCKISITGAFARFNETGNDLYDFENNPYPIFTEANDVQSYFYKHMNNSFFMHVPTWKCGYCMMYCPAGKWKERFYDKGLSRIDTQKLMREQNHEKQSI